MSADDGKGEAVPVTKTARGQARAKITRKVKVVQELMNREGIEDIEDAMQELDLVQDEFSELNRLYTEALEGADDIKEADDYRAAVELDIEEFKHLVEDWKAFKRTYESAPAGSLESSVLELESGLEAAKQGRQREEQRLQELIAVQEEERHIIELRQQADGKRMELERLRRENEMRELQSRKQQLLEQQQFEVKMKALRDENQALEDAIVPPEISNRMDSTPRSKTTYQSRPSWEPSSIESDAQKPFVTLFTEAFSEVLNQSRQSNQSVVDALQMPQGDIDKFDGDPMKYHTFIQAFRTNVDNRAVDAATKLNCLHRHLIGLAKTTVEYTNAMDPEGGYKEALKVLEDRFGNRFRIGQAWVQKIMERSPVKGYTDLREFADLLRNCQQTMKAMKAESRIDNPQTLQIIWLKLPSYLQDRWTREDLRLQRDENRESSLEDMIKLIARAAEEANHPIYGKGVLSKERATEKSKAGKSSHDKRQAGSFAGSTTADSTPGQTPKPTPTSPKPTPTSGQSKCAKCDGTHPIYACAEFKRMRIVDRRELVRAKALCFNCLRGGHIGSKCPLDKVCGIDGCTVKHSKFLHMPRSAENQQQARNPGTLRGPPDRNQTTAPAEQTPSVAGAIQATPETPARSSSFAGGGSGKVSLPIVPARVRIPNSRTYVDTYALLDPGTDSTYCTEDLSKRLGAIGETQRLELNTLTQAGMEFDAQLVTLVVSNLADTERCLIPEVTVYPDLHISIDSKAERVELQRWPHLMDLNIPETEVREVHLLIGLDCPDLLRSSEERYGGRGEPFARRTPLGWAINGPLGIPSSISRRSHFVNVKRAPLEQDLERLWDMEESHSEEQGISVDDRRTLDLWNQSLKLDNGRYSMDIPFKDENLKLDNNRGMAEKRAESLRRRLNRDENLREKYTKEIKKLLDMGYAERVPEDQLQRADGKVWYLPHQPVINPKKPDKCRIVNDCAAKYCGYSLNDKVMQGPDLTNSLVGVLLRFRQGDVAFMADIEAMFMQVKVNQDHRDVLRFLWFEDHNTDAPFATYRMTSHLFGGVWSPSCANYALRHTAEELREEYSDEVVETVNRNFYVDDCLKSRDGTDETLHLATQLRDLLAKRGFNLTKWVSNEPDLLRAIPQDHWGKSLSNLDINLDSLPNERALGMLWRIQTDTFGFDVQVPDNPTTKRGVLSTLSSLYDPLGLVSPFILRARQIFQQLCRLKLEWDEQLPTELEEPWGRWLTDLPKLKDVAVPRCVKPKGTQIVSAQLHHFSDASELAYGAASYLRLVCSDGFVQVHLMMAKSRLAPLKGSTIPRLELAGALEAVRLDKILRKELDIELRPAEFWTDSTIVLWYINHTEKRFQTYVANRVAKILSHTDPCQWRHVPTELNPGDDTSRGLTAEEILTNERWTCGPGFLKDDPDSWPETPSLNRNELESQAELKRVAQAYSARTQSELDSTAMLLHHYSSWFRLKKAVAWYRRLAQKLLLKTTPAEFRCQQPTKLTGPITAEELYTAEVAVLRIIQRSLPDAKTMPALGPVLDDDGLWRVTGRLGQSTMPQDAKHQILLPTNHHVVHLIVREAHQRSGHAGVERVLSDLRQRFWLVSGRRDVRTVVDSCITCRRSRGKMGVQLMADLPQSRSTAGEPPFSRMGVDYFGPFLVKRGRSEVKRYGCLFTCFATRAVHLEVAHSLDTDSFINALERFIARRGEPKEIWSDNGTNFVGAETEMKRTIQQWNQTQIHQHLLRRQIDWHFNTPRASHMGGLWERQIRTVRSVLAGLGGERVLDDEGLLTLLTVVEGIVNGRPITKLSDDPEDDRPLTPNHLLRLAPAPTVPPGNFTEKDVYRRRWRQVQALADMFWRRWLNEYLPSLQTRQRWTKTVRDFEPGDLVLVSQESTPRNHWPLGLVVDVRRSWDKLVRTAVVRTATGEYTRPITKLCLLEAAATDDPQDVPV